MNNFVKAGGLVIYLLAIVSTFGVFPPGAASVLQTLALVLLAAHSLELVFAFKSVQRYPGPLVDSIALTLLFGFLHWKPLAKRE